MFDVSHFVLGLICADLFADGESVDSLSGARYDADAHIFGRDGGIH
jgi:hypothetical protein